MKVKAALILALVLAVVLLTPRAAGAQPAGKVYPLIKATPQKIIAQGADWRFLNELKKELKA